jgi:hypothetical protein
MGYREEWNKIGYNLEELYFEKLNRELIRKLKAEKPETAAKMDEKNETMGVVLQFRSKTVTETPIVPEKMADVVPLKKAA